jgi:transposase
MPRRPPSIALDPPTRADLQRLARAPSTPQGLAQRARIVLSAAEGFSNQRIAAHYHLSVNTVGKWRIRFVLFGLAGLTGYPRGRPRKYGPEVRKRLHYLLDRVPPGGRERWTIESLARQLAMPRSSVYELLLETGSKSRRQPARRRPVRRGWSPRAPSVAGRSGRPGRMHAGS